MVEPWFKALQEEVIKTSQNKAAAKCSISSTAASQVLKGIYPGNIENVAEKVKGALLANSVVCPVLDKITTDVCAGYRKAKFSPNNPTRVRLYRACQTCANNPKNQGEWYANT